MAQTSLTPEPMIWSPLPNVRLDCEVSAGDGEIAKGGQHQVSH
jgi:hypothetical protein